MCKGTDPNEERISSTSSKETRTECRLRTAKFVVCNVPTRSAGETHFTCDRAVVCRNFLGVTNACGEIAALCRMDGDNDPSHWRMTTRSPCPQLSATPPRPSSTSGDRQF